MLACGLPVVDLDQPSDARGASARTARLLLAAARPDRAWPTRSSALLERPRDRARRRDAGLALVSERTWERAAEQVEVGLRAALTVRG